MPQWQSMHFLLHDNIRNQNENGDDHNKNNNNSNTDNKNTNNNDIKKFIRMLMLTTNTS